MPTLKQIACSLELSPTGTKLKEYATRYTDGGVEVYVAIPDIDLPFHLRVTSSGYIAPGLAAYVFIDGQYQCNRNRQGLRPPASGVHAHEYEVDFVFRQREEKTSQGHFIGRDWTFARLETASANTNNASDINPHLAANVGTIEIVVLRCKDAFLQASPNHRGYIAPPSLHPHLATKSQPTVLIPGYVAATHTKPASKTSTKAPTKTPSKKPLSDENDMIAGLCGLFDGGGDEPGQPRHVPDHYVARPPLPGYRWDTRTGTYRYHRSDDPYVDLRHRERIQDRSHIAPQGHERYEPTPLTIHGGRVLDHQQTPRLSPVRSRAVEDRHRPLASPALEHHVFRPEHGLPLHQPSHTPRQSSHELQRHEEGHPGFSFVLDVCKQVETLYRLAFKERKKAEGLHFDAGTYRNDPDLHFAALKALRRKEAEIESLENEMAALFSAIFARMRRMDRDVWLRTRDYLVVESRLVFPEHPELREWQDPKLRQYEPQLEMKQDRLSNGRPNQGWQELGQGNAGGMLWQLKQREQLGAGENQNQQQRQNQNVARTVSPDAIDRVAKEGNSLDQAEHRAAGGNLASAATRDNHKDEKVIEPRAGKAENSTTGLKNNGNAWENNNSGHGNDEISDNWNPWDQNNCDAPQNHVSGVKQASSSKASTKGAQQQGISSWKVSAPSQGQRSQDAKWDSGRNDKNEETVKTVNEPFSRSPRKADSGIASITTRVEPVIKPYWAKWNIPVNSREASAARARDPYEYPETPKPTVPADRAAPLSHGVATGRGAKYTHRTFRPEYLDTMEKPYAVFTFKYRSKGALEKTLNREIQTTEVQQAIQEAERMKLLRMPKDQLVGLMMRMNQSSEKPAWETSGEQPRAQSDVKASWDARNEKSQKPASVKQQQQSGVAAWGPGNTALNSNDMDASGGWENNKPAGDRWALAEDSWKEQRHSSRSSKKAHRGDGNGDGKDDDGSAWGGSGNWDNDPNDGGKSWHEDRASKSAGTLNLFGDDKGLNTTKPGFVADTGAAPDNFW